MKLPELGFRPSHRKGRAGRMHHLGGGRFAFRWNGRGDVRGYVPPPGFSAVADLVEHHPATGGLLGESQWWLFLEPETGEEAGA